MACGAEIGTGLLESQALLNRFRLGDPAAFEALFRRHQRAVYGWLLRIVRDPGTAEDLTIEAFFRMHRAHDRFDPAREFEPWARRIATHAALDWLRARRPEQPVAPEFFATVAARGGSDPVISAEIRRNVALAFARLPPKLRAAAALAVIEERPHKEIAEALGITAAAVKLRVFRAMRKLRNELEQMGMKP
jgi:RNA polymerase sigma-70 factor (ECF subfamily)